MIKGRAILPVRFDPSQGSHSWQTCLAPGFAFLARIRDQRKAELLLGNVRYPGQGWLVD